MIIDMRHKGWRCSYKEPGFIDVLDDVLNYRMKVLKVFKNAPPSTKVFLIETQYGNFVVKVSSPKRKVAEKFIKSIFFGNYNKNLIEMIDFAKRNGVRAPNDFYLLAEKRLFKFSRVSVMVFEYIAGPSLSEVEVLSGKMKAEVVSCMESMHSMGLVSGDPHKGNFILSDNGIRAIDLSGKPYSQKRVAEDLVLLDAHMSIPTNDKGVWYWIVCFRSKIRVSTRRLRHTLMRTVTDWCKYIYFSVSAGKR